MPLSGLLGSGGCGKVVVEVAGTPANMLGGVLAVRPAKMLKGGLWSLPDCSIAAPRAVLLFARVSSLSGVSFPVFLGGVLGVTGEMLGYLGLPPLIRIVIRCFPCEVITQLPFLSVMDQLTH